MYLIAIAIAVALAPVIIYRVCAWIARDADLSVIHNLPPEDVTEFNIRPHLENWIGRHGSLVSVCQIRRGCIRAAFYHGDRMHRVEIRRESLCADISLTFLRRDKTISVPCRRHWFWSQLA